MNTTATNDPFDRGISTFRGTRDYSGDDARRRQAVIQVIKEVFELYGFEPLETPAIENERTLTGKYGDEGEMKRFRLSLPFPKDGGLRYDQTVPLARFMAMNWNLFPMPYRRYVIGPVWRNESSAADRLREFTQCDFDTVGSSSPIIDAEVIAMNFNVFNRLNFGDRYVILINDRRLLDAITLSLDLNQNCKKDLFRAWDNLEKKDWSSILNDLRFPLDSEGKPIPGASDEVIEKIDSITTFLRGLQTKGNDEIINEIEEKFQNTEVLEAVKLLRNLLTMIRAYKVPEKRFQIDPLLARGLDYYTGPIFETVILEGNVGSITGGGRFDNLIETLGGPNLPASGSSFGLERIMKVMNDLQIPYPDIDSPEVFVTIFDNADVKFIQASLKVASKFRLDNIKTEVYTGDNKKLGKQFDIAQRKKFKFVVVIGPDEIKNSLVTIKRLQTGEQSSINIEDAVRLVVAENS